MRVTDRQIQEVLTALEAEEGRASGARVRAELARRYGVRGGVARVYRLLASARGAARTHGADGLAPHVIELQQALAAALKRAELAEHRETAHQDWAANQIYALRSKLRELEAAPRVQGVRHEEYLEIHRKLAVARLRIAELEAANTPASAPRPP